MNLHEHIQQFVSLGETEPQTIAAKVKERLNTRQLRDELAALADDVITDLARRELGRIRRSSEIALVAGDEMSSSEMKIAKCWIPGRGWIKAAQMTRDDALAKAEWYRQFAQHSLARAEWHEQVAEMMKKEGAKTLGALKATLPPLSYRGELVA
jgi:tRNA A37 N6-isopentenylltransferase MiaA